jgi:hypothetical protein
MSRPLTAPELENIPGSPAWHIKQHGLFESKVGDHSVILTKGLGEYLAHDDQGNQIGSGETPACAMFSAMFGLGGTSFGDEDDEDEYDEEEEERS